MRLFPDAAHKDWREIIDVGPLSSRAWTLQERILPPRVLQYAKERLVWQCYSKTDAEASLGETQVENSEHQVKYTPISYSQRHAFRKAIPSMLGSPNTSRETIYQLWYDLLNTYSRRRMTFDTDKIAAISGIAKIFSQLLKDELIYAIWKGDAARSILWATLQDVQTILKAPSWSWAKSHGQINFCWRTGVNGQYGMPSYLASTRTAEIDCNMMAAGQLIIFGLSQYANEIEVDHSTHSDMRSNLPSSLVFPGNALIRGEVYVDEKERFKVQSSTSRLYCVQIGNWTTAGYNGNPCNSSSPHIAGLCLRETEITETFKRVGVFSITSGIYNEQG